MSAPKLHRPELHGLDLHGGDVSRAASELNCRPGQLLDFSSNINPRGLPPVARAALVAAAENPALMARYPDAARHPLRRMLAERLQLDPSSIVLGAGASALLADAVRALRPSSCLLLAPAFAEYRRVSEAAGARCFTVPLSPQSGFALPAAAIIDSLHRLRPNLLFLNNPHNPSGVLTARAALEPILRAAARIGTTVLLDEAFIDYAPQQQWTADAARLPHLISIRSLTKFYGCPALRIGFAVACRAIAEQIEQQMPAWPVGSLALETLAQALGDEDYAIASREENERERAALASRLTTLGFLVYSSTANFLLAKIPPHWPDSSTLRAQLLQHHRILIRDCRNFETLEDARHIRIAVLSAASNDRLVTALGALALKLGQPISSTSVYTSPA